MKRKKHCLHVDLPPISKDVPTEVKLFLRHLANAGKAAGTLRHYRDILTHFLGYFDGAEAGTITTDMLNEFFHDERRRRAAATVNVAKAAVRSFYKYLLGTEKISKDPSRLIASEKVVNKSPGTFSAAQRAKLPKTIAEAKGSPMRPGPMRDWMMIILAYNTGLRVAELVGVNIEDVEDRRTLEVIGKGQKLRILPLNAAARRALAEYLPWRRALETADRKALFVNRFGRRISGDFSPHSFRHSYLRRGRTLEFATVPAVTASTEPHLLDRLRQAAQAALRRHGVADDDLAYEGPEKPADPPFCLMRAHRVRVHVDERSAAFEVRGTRWSGMRADYPSAGAFVAALEDELNRALSGG